MQKLFLKITKILLFSIVAGAIFSGCATIVGGSKYYAHVNVNNHPNARIVYKGFNEGSGYAVFKAPRLEADKFTVIVKEDNCDEQQFKFTQKSFRGWALVGSIVTWTGTIVGIPIPWGVFLDVTTGAYWKPDIDEKGVTKSDFKNFNYAITYTGCKDNGTNTSVIKTKEERLIDLKDLLDKGVIKQDEYDIARKKIIEE